MEIDREEYKRTKEYLQYAVNRVRHFDAFIYDMNNEGHDVKEYEDELHEYVLKIKELIELPEACCRKYLGEDYER